MEVECVNGSIDQQPSAVKDPRRIAIKRTLFFISNYQRCYFQTLQKVDIFHMGFVSITPTIDFVVSHLKKWREEIKQNSKKKMRVEINSRNRFTR